MINKFPVGPVYASRPASGRDGSGSGTRRKTGSKSLRYLDLSFEGRQHTKSSDVLNNGFRPHGGQRGVRSHPPSPYSFNKSAEYHESLQDDLEELIAEDGRTTSPAWAVQASHEPTHSGESPLFVNKLIASNSRLDREGLAYPKTLPTNGRLKNPPPSADGSRLYRPNSMHQFLAHTELKNASQNEVNTRLGRPTRTTLLRARQRCNSAPVNAYEARRELQNKAEKKIAMRDAWCSNSSLKDILDISVPDGESLHGFLTGARYNRAHYLDSKSLIDHGVYMPRGNPLGCFVVKTKSMREDIDFGQPLDSPISDLDSIASEESFLDGVNYPHPSPISSPAISPEPQMSQPVPIMDPDLQPDQEATIEIPAPPVAVLIPRPAVTSHHSTLPGPLNVKGVGFNQPRPNSAHNMGAEMLKIKVVRPQTARVLPTVVIKGRAISPSPRREPLDTAASAIDLCIQPVPHQRTKDLLKIDIQPTKVVEKSEKLIHVPTKVDKSVNVPSISGDNQPCDDLDVKEAVTMDEKGEREHSTEKSNDEYKESHGKEVENDEQVKFETADAGTQHVIPQPIVRPISSSTTRDDRGSQYSDVRSKKGKVRFADQITQERGDNDKENALNEEGDTCIVVTPLRDVTHTDVKAPEKGDSVQFFLTEDKENPCVDNGEKNLPEAHVAASNEQKNEQTASEAQMKSEEIITIDISLKTPD